MDSRTIFVWKTGSTGTLRIAMMTIFFLIVSSCVTGQDAIKKSDDLPDTQLTGSVRAMGNAFGLSTEQSNVLDKAYDLLGKAPDASVTVNGRRFKLDCIGTVAAVFYAAGIDLTEKYARAPGRNGVSKFYNYLKSIDAIHQNKLPNVGDVVFWDNTWDYNGNGKFGDDPLTHVGIVTKVEADGTVHYIHEHRLYGIVVERMNLFSPDVRYDITGKEINSPMHANSGFNKRNNIPWLSGDLWRQCGGVLTDYNN